MDPLTQLRADDVVDVLVAAQESMLAHAPALDRLDRLDQLEGIDGGDTGTHLAATLGAVVAGLTPGVTLTQLATDLQSVAASAGVGRSGRMLAAFLGGFAELCRNADALDPVRLAMAFEAGSDAIAEATADLRPGALPSVAEVVAAVALRRADDGMALPELVIEVADRGLDALERTPELWAPLAEAGVVDAGGTGFLLLLDALLTTVDGRPLPPAADVPMADGVAAMAAHVEHAHGEGDISDLRYEVMFFLEAPDDTIPAFKDVWAGIGDSIVVVGGDGLWNCHIHCDDIGASIEAALDCGRPRNIRVTDLLEQVEEEKWVREADPEPEVPAHATEPVETAVVAVATGSGISRIFYSLGVQQIVTGGQTMNPSTADLIAAVEAAPADNVVILPNNKNIIPVAEQVAAHTAKSVHVVPTRGIAEGFASLIAYDPEAGGADNAKAMDEAAEAVVAGEVTQAVRDSTCDLGPIAEGDYLGVCNDGIRAVSGSIDEACTRLLDVLVTDDHELVTIIEGDGASSAVTRHIEVWLGEHHPDVGTEIHHGGQPLYPYLFGIE